MTATLPAVATMGGLCCGTHSTEHPLQRQAITMVLMVMQATVAAPVATSLR